MEQKDPKDMTASELMRVAANRVEMEGNSQGAINCLRMTVGVDDEITYPKDLAKTLSALADKIDAELAQARRSGLERAAKSWAKANGWPDFREGEDFGAWLDRCALKLPCDKDGEPWSIGDRVMPGNRSESTVTGYSFDGADWFLKYRWCGIDSYANEFATSCKRPAPEVLGADGKPIVEGETVYPIDGEWLGIPLEVLGIESLSVKVSLPSGKGWTMFGADHLTHEEPDTQERIDADAKKLTREYWGCCGLDCADCPATIGEKSPDCHYSVNNCDHAMHIDLLRRQRELDKRTGGAE